MRGWGEGAWGEGAWGGGGGRVKQQVEGAG